MSACPQLAPAAEVDVGVPPKLLFLFEPSRYKVAYGGRGAAKSWAFARALLVRGACERIRVLCAREIQRSIADSVHKLLRDQIDSLGLAAFYRVTDTAIRGANGTEFIFCGLYRNVTQIKSMEGIDVCWVEEAETVSDESWNLLIPTIRQPGSEIWISFNPGEPDDATYTRFVANPPPGAVVVKVGWADNPWLTAELRAEKDHLYATDPDQADWVWGGNFRPPLTGRCYHAFDVDKHASTPVEYDRRLGEVQLWCDFNVHAMRWSLVQCVPREIRVFDEIALGRNQDTETAADETVRRLQALGHRGTVVVCGDASGNARRSSATKTDYTILREKLQAAGWTVHVRVPAANPPVLERVRAVNWHLKGHEGRSVLVDRRASELIKDFARVGWKEGTQDIDKSDPERTHASDAFGYGVWNNDRPVVNEAPTPSIEPIVIQHAARMAEAREW